MKMNTAHVSTQSTLQSIIFYNHLQLFKMSVKCLLSLLAFGAKNKQSLAVTSGRKDVTYLCMFCHPL